MIVEVTTEEDNQKPLISKDPKDFSLLIASLLSNQWN